MGMALSVGSGNVDGEAEDCACISMRHLSLVSFLFLCSLPQAAGIRRLFYFVVVDHIWNLVWFCTHSFDIALYCVCMDASQVIHTFTLVGSSFIHLSQFHSSSVFIRYYNFIRSSQFYEFITTCTYHDISSVPSLLGFVPPLVHDVILSTPFVFYSGSPSRRIVNRVFCNAYASS